ncbi:MAG: ornithine cyclodeaminase [Pseudomonadota bacterium]
MFDAQAVHDGLPYDRLIPALIQAHQRDVDAVQSVLMEQPASGPGVDHFLTLPAWQRGRAFGAKLVSVFPGNDKAGQGLPAIQGVYVLFDGQNGRPSAVIDGTALTLRKTAADSGAGAHFLAPENPASMLMVGAGALAPHLIAAHIAARPSITDVAIWNRTPARAERLAASLDLPGRRVDATADLEGAARGADVISCATMADEPLILGAWLKPGAHLDLVGSYTDAMHECDEEAVRRARVFTDSPWSALKDSGEIVSALASGALRRDRIEADLFAFARGQHAGRGAADAITLFKNGGGGHLDLMVAQILAAGGGIDPETGSG